MTKQALIVIDLQNDYFPDGKYTLWNTDSILTNTEAAIVRARAKNIPVLLVQHIANETKGPSPFFSADSTGVALHARILAAAPDSVVITKQFADSFHQTLLEQTLANLGVEELLICGMMTQNCVTHTAISKAAEKYAVKVLSDCCTTIDPMTHALALNALSTRIEVAESTAVL